MDWEIWREKQILTLKRNKIKTGGEIKCDWEKERKENWKRNWVIRTEEMINRDRRKESSREKKRRGWRHKKLIETSLVLTWSQVCYTSCWKIFHKFSVNIIEKGINSKISPHGIFYRCSKTHFWNTRIISICLWKKVKEFILYISSFWNCLLKCMMVVWHKYW